MKPRAFEMRLFCRYTDAENQIAELAVEHLEDGEWRNLDLTTRSPGFQVFVYSVFTCQHTYFRSNCAELGLALHTAQGSLHLVSDESWGVQSIKIHFDAILEAGAPTPETVDFIVARMKQCPVSANIKDVPISETRIRFD